MSIDVVNDGDPYMNAMNTVDIMDKRLADLQGLQFQEDFQRALASGQNPLPAYTSPTFAATPAPQAEPANPMAGWASSPGQGGLGLAAQPSAPQGQPSLGEYLGQQMYPGVKLDWLDKHRLGMMGTSSQYVNQRQQLAQQLAKQEEDARQHDLQLLEKTMANPKAKMMLDALSQNPKFRFSKQAGQMSRVLKDADFSAIQAFQEVIPEDVLKKFMSGQMDDYELSAWADTAREQIKFNQKEKSKAHLVQQALNVDPEQRTPYQAQLVKEKEEADTKKQMEALKDYSQAAKNFRDAEHGNVKFTQMTQEISSELFDKPFENLSQAQRTVVEKEKERRLQGRTSQMIAQGLPQPIEKRSNTINRKAFLKTGALEIPPGGVTKNQIDSGDYIEITDKQKEAWGEIVNSGNTLKALFDLVEPLIKATKPAQAAKQYMSLLSGAYTKSNPAAATYMADSEAFSSRMARVFGSEVGVLTQGDVDRWKRALPTFGDTVAVKDSKKKVFMDIYQQSRAMAIKKIAGEDISADYQKLQDTLNKAEKINPPSIDEDFNTLMGGKR